MIGFSMLRSPLTEADRRQIAARGLDEAEVLRQLALLREPPAPIRLARACRLGDGIGRIEPSRHDALLASWQQAADAGRLTKLVPASGAATRMFQFLAARLESGAPLEGGALDPETAAF